MRLTIRDYIRRVYVTFYHVILPDNIQQRIIHWKEVQDLIKVFPIKRTSSPSRAHSKLRYAATTYRMTTRQANRDLILMVIARPTYRTEQFPSSNDISGFNHRKVLFDVLAQLLSIVQILRYCKLSLHQEIFIFLVTRQAGQV